MERAAVICKGGTVEVGDLPFGSEVEETESRAPGGPPIPEGATLRDIERQVPSDARGRRRTRARPRASSDCTSTPAACVARIAPRRASPVTRRAS
jgi:hypothetical protein